MVDKTTLRERVPVKDTKPQWKNDSATDDPIETPHSKSPTQDDSIRSSTTIATTIFSPALITTLVLIFGGCCSNVYTLESILKSSPATGTLVTFIQFLLTSLFTLRSQVTTKPPEQDDTSASASTTFRPRLRTRLIPLSKWLIYTAFFLTINILNNTAFNYRISIPLHIILRSAGPVTSMLVGYFVGGRRYTPRQITAVVLLFTGVVLAALSDARSKSRPQPGPSVGMKSEDISMQSLASTLAKTKFSDQAPGFVLLFAALLVSAIMGLYTDELYNTYGRSAEVTNENIFYSHTLSLPFFALQSRTLRHEYNTLRANFSTLGAESTSRPIDFVGLGQLQPILAFLPHSLLHMVDNIRFTDLKPFFLLLANATTQIVCITGVHRLSTQTTALTVSIVLNIRKLVSLLLSIWLFGNQLASGVAFGAALVFLGGGLYGWRPKAKEINQKAGPSSGKKEL